LSKLPERQKPRKPKKDNNKKTHKEKLGEFIERLREKIDKPCKKLGYCPYGPLVEQFPLAEDDDPDRCAVFGHVCPVFSVAEPFISEE